MKKIFVACCLWCGIPVSAQTHAPLSQYDMISYALNVELFDETDSISVGGVVKYRLTDPNCREIVLDLIGPDAITKKGMTVTVVTCSSLPSQQSTIAFRQEGNKVMIPAQKDTASQWFYIRYKGIPADGMIIGKNKFGERTFFSDNWPDRAAHWIACVNHPADKATFVWHIEAPAYYTATCNGILTMEVNAPGDRKSWTFIEDHPIPVKVAAVGVARFDKILSGNIGCVPVYKYYYPQTAGNKYFKFDNAMEILRFYSSLIGEYPFQKLANVQSTTIFGGMENAGNIFYDENRVDDYQSIEALVAHEIAHQWFGNTVTEKSYAHLWLSEGFAVFFTNFYLEKKYGKDTLKKRLKDDWNKVNNFSRNNPLPVVNSTKNYMSLLNPLSYQKGGLFLQTLREQLGDETFFKVIRSYFNKYKYKNADTEDFRAEVEAITRKDWKEFFDDWLYKTKLPGKYGAG